MDRTQMESAILSGVKLQNGRRQISCARAHVLSEDLGVSLGVIGHFCQRHDIKLTDCQLGCFGSATSRE